MPRIVIFANGELPDAAKARALVRPNDVIVCADGGSRHARALGVKPDLIIGDLDSILRVDWAAAKAAGITVQQHPHDKNETDLELAVQYAIEQKPTEVLIIGALGKRLDQTLGNIALISDARLAQLDVRLDDGVEEVFFCRAQSRIEGGVGDIVSLLPWGGAVEGVVTEGLGWALRSETLYPDKTRGISNELIAPRATVTITSGLLLIVHRRQTQLQNRHTDEERIP